MSVGFLFCLLYFHVDLIRRTLCFCATRPLTLFYFISAHRIFKTQVYDHVSQGFTQSVLRQLDRERDECCAGENEGEEEEQWTRVDMKFLTEVLEAHKEFGGAHNDRSSRAQDADSIRMEKMVADTELLVRLFWEPYLASIREYYKNKALAWAEVDVSEYLKTVEGVLLQETRWEKTLVKVIRPVWTPNPAFPRVTDNRPPVTPVVPLLKNVLLDGSFLEKALDAMAFLLQHDKQEDLARVYSLYSGVPGEDGQPLSPLARIAKIVEKHNLELGIVIVKSRLPGGGGGKEGGAEGGSVVSSEKETSDNPTFIKQILDLHDKARSLVSSQFKGDQLFHRAIESSFKDFLNKDQSKASKYTNCELLAHYADRVLTGTDKLDESSVERESGRIVGLVAYLNDQDIFGEVYTNLLAKRLLSGKTASDAGEKNFIQKLKLANGAMFTSRMEGMLNDLTTHAEQNRAFTTWDEAHSKVKSPADFSVQVLTNGWWPQPLALLINLPPVLKTLTQRFESWFSSQRANRRLAWSNSQGTLTVKASYGSSKSHLFDLNTLQGIVLLLFNDVSGPLTVQEIAARVGCENTEACKRILHSLACAKFKILTKEPSGSSIKDKDTFVYNPDFSSPSQKLKVPMPSLEETHNKVKVEIGRVQVIDACVVRIMKARKTLQIQTLIEQTLQHVSSLIGFLVLAPTPTLHTPPPHRHLTHPTP